MLIKRIGGNSISFIVQVPKIVQFYQTAEMNWISYSKCWNHNLKKVFRSDMKTLDQYIVWSTGYSLLHKKWLIDCEWDVGYISAVLLSYKEFTVVIFS